MLNPAAFKEFQTLTQNAIAERNQKAEGTKPNRVIQNLDNCLKDNSPKSYRHLGEVIKALGPVSLASTNENERAVAKWLKDFYSGSKPLPPQAEDDKQLKLAKDTAIDKLYPMLSEKAKKILDVAQLDPEQLSNAVAQFAELSDD